MRINKLDGFRGIFSIMVVLYHFNEDIVPEYFFNNFFIRESYMFVDFFFVLSGFVISLNYNLLKSKNEFFNFIKKRFIRLFPLIVYTVGVFFSLMVVGPLFLPDQFNNINTLSHNILLAVDSLFFTNSTPLFGTSLGMNYPSWSISSEMFSYLLYGFILINFRKKGIVFSLVILLSLVFLYFFTEKFNVTGDYGFIRGFYSFFIGVFVCRVYSFSKLSFNSSHETLTLLLIICSLHIFHNDDTKTLIFLGPIVFGISIFVFSKSRGFITNILEKPLFQFLGKTSYSIYLNHSLIVLVIPRLIYGVFKVNKTDINMILVLLFTIFVVFLYSWFTYKFVELKGGKFLKRIITFSKF